jgi:hypothetical protein
MKKGREKDGRKEGKGGKEGRKEERELVLYSFILFSSSFMPS